MLCCVCLFFFKQKTAYEMRISDWSSDVCSSDLPAFGQVGGLRLEDVDARERLGGHVLQVEVAADRRKDFAPVDRGEHIGKPAHADVAEFVVAVHGDLDAGHALERGGGGGIGQLADVLCDDRIDHLHRDRKSTRLNSSH